jgi:Tol biopolymer transport system component
MRHFGNGAVLLAAVGAGIALAVGTGCDRESADATRPRTSSTETAEARMHGTGELQAARGTIAFLRNGRLWLMNADGTRQRSTGFHASDFPAWSPDGRSIAFNSGGARARLWIADPQRGARRPLTPVSPYDCTWLSWSPDGRRIAYTTNAGCEGELTILVVNRDGTGRRRLRPGDRHLDQTWSPDGRFILFASFPAGRPEKTTFSIVPADGGRTRTLRGVHGSADGYARRPVAAWARNGRIYVLGGGGLFRINADGTGRRRLGGALQIHDFALSPNQRQIAFSAFDGRRRDIYVMNTNGGGLRKLTQERRVANVDPQWSPDGRRLLFLRARGPYAPYEIYVMNADGTGVANISKHPASETGPTWAWTGRRTSRR